MSRPLGVTEQTGAEKRRKLLILAGVLSVMFLASMNSTTVSTAMPRVIRSLDGMDLYTWPFTVYMLCTAVVIPVVGKLSDSFGFRVMFFLGLGFFLAGAALCGTSKNMLQLILYRGVQGIGAGIISAGSLGIIGVTFSPVERARYMGLSSSVYALASIVGPVLGGIVTERLSWRWIFFMNIPLGIIAAVFLFFTLPGKDSETEKESVDVFGIITFIPAAVSLLLAFTWAGKRYPWSSALIITMLSFSMLMMVVFFFIEKRTEQAIIPPALFRNRVFSVCTLGMFLLNGVIIGLVIFVPLYCQEVMDADASVSGAVLSPLMFGLVASSALCGMIISRTRKYKAVSIIGVGILTACLVLIRGLASRQENFGLGVFMVMGGTGLGLALPVFNIAVQNAFPREQVGMVTAVLQFFRLLGTTAFSAVFGSIMAASLNTRVQGGVSLSAPVRDIFFACLIISSAVGVLLFFLKELPLRERNE